YTLTATGQAPGGGVATTTASFVVTAGSTSCTSPGRASVSPSSLDPGKTATFTATGFAPRSSVVLIVSGGAGVIPPASASSDDNCTVTATIQVTETALPGPYTVRATGAPSSGGSGNTSAILTVTAASGSISGFVLEEDLERKVGGSVSGATITGGGQSATSRSDGSFTLANVPVGSVTVTVSAPGFASGGTAVTVEGGKVTEAGLFMIVRNVGGISGFVLEEDLDGKIGGPVSGATITVGGLSATSGSDGSFTLANVPVGSVTVTVSAPGFASGGNAVTVEGGKVTEAGLFRIVRNAAPSPSDLGGVVAVQPPACRLIRVGLQTQNGQQPPAQGPCPTCPPLCPGQSTITDEEIDETVMGLTLVSLLAIIEAFEISPEGMRTCFEEGVRQNPGKWADTHNDVSEWTVTCLGNVKAVATTLEITTASIDVKKIAECGAYVQKFGQPADMNLSTFLKSVEYQVFMAACYAAETQ
ncbi:MAG: Carboxypeptidase regulatory-like domain, partial [Chloroflexi bacterium]|nr:Carboxypeptidase regulatory-like domain [Chloroflexota bacterium]